MKYHKINSLFMRDMEKTKKLIVGAWARPEFEFLQNNIWEFTEKVDGTNIRVTLSNSGSVTFGGRTDAAQIPAKLFSNLNAIFNSEEGRENMFKQFPRDDDESSVTLYGEGFGAGIQKGGGNYSAEQSFVLFDVLVDGWWLERKAVEEVAKNLGCAVVPVVGYGTLQDAVDYVKSKPKSAWGDFEAEGIVVRPAVGLQTRSGARIISKVRVEDYV